MCLRLHVLCACTEDVLGSSVVPRAQNICPSQWFSVFPSFRKGVFQSFIGSPGLRAFVRAIGPFSVCLAGISVVRLLCLFVRSFIL